MTQIAIVLYPNFTALDFIGPYEVLRNLPDTEVRFVWHETGPVTADSGALLVGATHTLAETPAPDVILVPGGPGTVAVARDEKLLELGRGRRTPPRPGPHRCARHRWRWRRRGRSREKRATSHWSTLPALKMLGAIPVGDERVVHEGDVVTAAGVSAEFDLGLWLAGEIGGENRANAIQLIIEYDPQPPFDSGHMSKASAATKATATALISKDLITPAAMKDTTLLVWDQAIKAVRNRRRKAATG